MHGTPDEHLLPPRWRTEVIHGNGSRLGGFYRHVPAQLTTPILVRRELGAWLDALHWPEHARDDLILAVSEAVSNAAEHAYPPGRSGDIHVTASLLVGPGQTQRVIATVVDHGRWRDPPSDNRFRRRGLQIMRAVTDEFRLDAAPDGTRVTLVSPPVRPKP